MHFTTKYSISKIRISSTKYILNHLENYLLDKEFIITQKTDSHLKYQNKYLYWGTIFSLASFAKAGKIKIYKENDTLEIKLIYTEYWSITFILILGLIVYLIEPGFDIRNMVIVMTPILFINIFVFRYIAQGIIFNKIKEIMRIISN